MAHDRSRRAGVHRLRRGTHELLGPAGRMARQADHSRAGRPRHRAKVSRVCGHLRGREQEEMTLCKSELSDWEEWAPTWRAALSVAATIAWSLTVRKKLSMISSPM